VIVASLALAAFVNPSREPRVFGSGDRTIVYAVLGDSTAAGQGADYESGIAVVTARHLALQRRVVMTNFGVSGARIRDVVEEQLAGAESLHADWVLLSVGANDVTHLTSIASMRRDLLEIVHRLRRANANVRIVITGSPDMGSPPRIPRLLRPVAAWRTRKANRMFVAVAAAERLTFAPIAEETGPLFRRDPSLFDADRFHPNERGYAAWNAVLTRSFGR
jgi:lysophospholipase L1-like esterase